ncbi:MAG: hypothetical protein QOF78_2751 [Phycisphaerales bacterium]|jgi:tetratricopeptide (TPR) repeat protein|nr:hypothetical protein [Phycisphaerales bacterium]
MKSNKLFAVVAVAALALAGCKHNKPEQETSRSKYSLLNGSTHGNDATATNDGPEPTLNVDTRFAAGRLAETQGRYDSAAEQYEQALQLKPDHVASLYRLGIVHTRTRHFDTAATIWRRYIKATGDIASGYSNLGFCYEMAGDTRSAENAYKEGIERDPNCMPCRTNYGLMLARNNRIPEAKTQLSAALKPDEVAYNLAAVYEQKGAIVEARQELKKAIEINPNNREAQTRLANLPLD